MRISKKIFITISAIITLYSLAVIVVIKLYIYPQFASIDINEADKDLSRAQNALNREIEDVKSFCLDYARWNDTFNFLKNGNKRYVDENLDPLYLNSQKINLVCIHDFSGKIKYVAVYDFGNQKITDTRELQRTGDSFFELIREGSRDHNKEINGYLLIDSRLYVVSSMPVVDSLNQKMPDGRLIIGRIISKESIDKIENLFRLDVSLHVGKDISIITNKPKIKKLKLSDGYILREGNSLTGHYIIYDLYNKPVADIELKHDERFSEQGRFTMNLSLTILLVGGLVVLLAIIAFLRKKMLQPIESLTKGIFEIAEKDDLMGRLPVKGNDEVSFLAKSFNILIEKLFVVNSTLEFRVEKRTEMLSRSNRELSLMGKVFENSMDAIIITDLSGGKIIKINPAFTRITGFNLEEVIGKSPEILKSERHTQDFYEDMIEYIKRTGMWAGEHWSKNKMGRTYPQWLSISAIRDSQGVITNYLGVFHDISDAKQQENYIKYQAYHDNLTGLPNRTLFYERMEHAIERSGKHGLEFSLLYLDLDNFKNINDSLGHEYGDILLQHVAERLESQVRAADTVARFGGDEFLILAEDVDKEDRATILSERIISSFKNPMLIKDQLLHIGVSIGIAIYPRDGEEVGVLIRNADTAMYHSKDSGRNRYSFFTKNLNEQVARKLRLETELRMAISLNQFEVYYQPKMSPETGELIGFEGLARWNREGEIIYPAEFMQIAEETGLIIALDRIILEKACVELSVLNANREKPFKLALNSSVKALHKKTFPDEVQALIEKTGIKPEWIEIEITETDIMKDFDSCMKVIKRLAEMKISIALDDFGTGYSSLSQLTKLPVNTLKIDRSFIMKIDSGEQNTNIVSTINSMAKDLEMSVVAEGVETDRQMDYLTDIGCELIQGYYISRPLPFDQITEFIERWEDSVHKRKKSEK